ncbi:MAG: hypothetical protein R3Y28_04910 [Candidatus Gastranaerophilales bacterium]
MRSKVLKLIKRLNKASIDDIVPILGVTRAEISAVLEELVDEQLISKRDDDVYFYKEQKAKKSKLPLFFEFHEKDEIELITKCFLAEVEVVKVVKILAPQNYVINKFYKYFRQMIYKEQLKTLLNFHKIQPKTPQVREYMNNLFYLHLYKNKLFINDYPIKCDYSQSHSEAERLEIKNIYFRLRRKKFSVAYKTNYHLYFAEYLWRMDKTFEELEQDLLKLLYNA